MKTHMRDMKSFKAQEEFGEKHGGKLILVVFGLFLLAGLV